MVLTDPDRVAVVKRGAFHAKIVDKRAVEAGEILHHEAPSLDIHTCVIVRHGEVVDRKVVVGRAADPDRASSDGHFLHQLVFEHEA